MTDKPYKVGPFETITNIHFPSGLAVEFVDAAQSSLRGAANLNLIKATISVWFRIPSASAAAARAAGGVVVPILCLGNQQTNFVPSLNFNTYNDSFCFPNPYPAAGVSTNWTSATFSYPSGPSFIGVYYGGFFPDGCLMLNLQTKTAPALSGIYFGEFGVACNHITRQWESNFVDQSDAFEVTADSYGNAPLISQGIGGYGILATPDAWHHLLISWDLSHGCSSFSTPSGGPDQNFVTSVSKLFCALDGINRTGSDLPAILANRVSSIQGWGPNDIVSTAVGRHAGSVNGNASTTLSSPNLSVSSASIPAPLNIGIASQFNNFVYEGNMLLQPSPIETVEMAELQLFSGLSIDTGSSANRSLFVDANGKPVKPQDTQNGLGRRPDVLLHNSSNWIKGTNTGQNPASFAPNGRIIKYTPDPQLGK